MFKNLSTLSAPILALYLSSCVSTPINLKEEDLLRKEFSSPNQDTSGVYIYNNTADISVKRASLDGRVMQLAPMTYFYIPAEPGVHFLHIESQLTPGGIKLTTEGGKNYFLQLQIDKGVIDTGTTLAWVTEETGKEGVLECKLEQTMPAMSTNDWVALFVEAIAMFGILFSL